MKKMKPCNCDTMTGQTNLHKLENQLADLTIKYANIENANNAETANMLHRINVLKETICILTNQNITISTNNPS